MSDQAGVYPGLDLRVSASTGPYVGPVENVPEIKSVNQDASTQICHIKLATKSATQSNLLTYLTKSVTNLPCSDTLFDADGAVCVKMTQSASKQNDGVKSK
jgi:hypothetical protein